MLTSALNCPILQWFNRQQTGRLLTVRDLLSWLDFIKATEKSLQPEFAFLHGSFLVLLDGLTLGKSRVGFVLLYSAFICHHLAESLCLYEVNIIIIVIWQNQYYQRFKTFYQIIISCYLPFFLDKYYMLVKAHDFHDMREKRVKSLVLYTMR